MASVKTYTQNKNRRTDGRTSPLIDEKSISLPKQKEDVLYDDAAEEEEDEIDKQADELTRKGGVQEF